MKRPKLKKASKRVSCSTRYKIQKKVREHNRKQRKEAKKNGVSTRPKKDLGVPHSAPFREEVLREAEQRRLQIEEEKEKRKQAKKDDRAQKRQREKDGVETKEETKAKKGRKDEVQRKQKALEKNSKHYICSQINKVIDSCDVVLEVLDARDPQGCRCPQLEDLVLQKNKKLLFLLNKIDLVPKENVEKWLQSLQRECPVVLFKASTNIQEKTVKRSRVSPSNLLLDKSRGAMCYGSECVSELLSTFYSATQREGMLRVALVGFPNVGKSSVINSIKGVLACGAGVKRGITKSMQEVHLQRNINLVDSPGITASDSNPAPALVLRSLRVEDGLDTQLQAATTLLRHCDKTQVMLQYTVPDYRNPLEFLSLFAKKRGFLQKGGVANTEQAAAAFLSDWTGAKMSYCCRPPEPSHLPPHLSEAAAAATKTGWDLKRITAGNEEALRGVKFPNPSSSIGFSSRGFTVGLLQEEVQTSREEEVKEERGPEDVEEERGPEEVEGQRGPEEVKEERGPEEEEQQRGPEEEEVQQRGPEEVEEERGPEETKAQSAVAAAVPRLVSDAYDFNVDFK